MTEVVWCTVYRAMGKARDVSPKVVPDRDNRALVQWYQGRFGANLASDM